MMRVEGGIARRYPVDMADIREIRRRRLEMVIDRCGGQAELARKLSLDSPAYLSQIITRRRNVGHDFARKIEQNCGLSDGWMDQPIHHVVEFEGADYAGHKLAPAERQIPVIDCVQAGKPREVIDSYEPGDGFEHIGLDSELAASAGRYTFALEVKGESMLPDYKPGDLVVIDPDEPVRPGDDVVAKINRSEAATLKKFRDRGRDANDDPIYELIPRNDDYPPEVINAENPGRIIGPVIEHRRRFRRPNRQ